MFVSQELLPNVPCEPIPAVSCVGVIVNACDFAPESCNGQQGMLGGRILIARSSLVHRRPGVGEIIDKPKRMRVVRFPEGRTEMRRHHHVL